MNRLKASYYLLTAMHRLGLDPFGRRAGRKVGGDELPQTPSFF